TVGSDDEGAPESGDARSGRSLVVTDGFALGGVADGSEGHQTPSRRRRPITSTTCGTTALPQALRRRTRSGTRPVTVRGGSQSYWGPGGAGQQWSSPLGNPSAARPNPGSGFRPRGSL